MFSPLFGVCYVDRDPSCGLSLSCDPISVLRFLGDLGVFRYKQAVFTQSRKGRKENTTRSDATKIQTYIYNIGAFETMVRTPP